MRGAICISAGTVTVPEPETWSLPELPEVETTRRHLESAMLGRRMVDVSVRHERTARRNASGEEVEALLTGRTVVSVDRHGKFLVVGLDDEHVLVGHLGMSGRYTVVDNDEEDTPHTHFVATLDNGSQVRFIDPRTFGFVSVVDEDGLDDTSLARLGPDALTDPPTVEEMQAFLVKRTAPIKALLLDQGVVAGLGNIYADEALYTSMIHPLRPGGSLDADEIGRLLDAIRDVLESAVEHGGTTLDDLAYLLPDGRAGDNMAKLGAYGREGEPCARCGTPIDRVTVRARSTHFCPRCQR